MPIVVVVFDSQWLWYKRHPCVVRMMSFDHRRVVIPSFGWKRMIMVNHGRKSTSLATTVNDHILGWWGQMDGEAVRVVIKMTWASNVVVIVMLRTGLDGWVQWDRVRTFPRINHIKLTLAKVGKFGALPWEVLLGTTITSWLRVLMLSADRGLVLFRNLRMLLLCWVLYHSLLCGWRWRVLVNSTEVLAWVCRPLWGPCRCRRWYRQCRVITACIIVVIWILFTGWNGQVDRLCPLALLYALGYIEVPIAVLGGLRGCRWLTGRLLHVGSRVDELWWQDKAISLSAAVGSVIELVVIVPGWYTRHPDHLIRAISVHTLIASFYVS